jgi:hypothetical protein
MMRKVYLAHHPLFRDDCDWMGDYLKNNSEVEESDRTLCDGIGKK